MAYTIKVLQRSRDETYWVGNIIQLAIDVDRRFDARVCLDVVYYSPIPTKNREQRKEMWGYAGTKAIGFAFIIKPVRTKSGRHLADAEWIEFHALVNKVFSGLHMAADIWSTPNNAPGRLWIRQAHLPRQRWDSHTIVRKGKTLTVMNPGTADQFLPLPTNDHANPGHQATG